MAEWQTRKFQKLVPLRECGFESHLGYYVLVKGCGINYLRKTNMGSTTIEKEVLTGGGILFYIPDFFKQSIADKLFQVLKLKTNWKQEKTFYGNMFPRLTAYYADEGVKYAYSGVVHDALPWPWYLKEVKERVEKQTGEPFNSLLLNFYRDGKDSIGWHSDDEKELGVNPTVPSLSFGGERVFQIRHRATREKKEYLLKHGSLLIMSGTMQYHWQHCVPKTTKPVEPRINLTFRNIL